MTLINDLKHNFSASSAPAASDDSALGYSAGSQWYDTTADEIYLCVDATAGAAVWKLLASGGSVTAFTAAPTISGTETVGQELTATSGTYTSTGTPLVTWQWYADEVAIGGATASAYTLTASEEGALITVTQTVQDAYGTASSTSDPTGAIAAA